MVDITPFVPSEEDKKRSQERAIIKQIQEEKEAEERKALEPNLVTGPFSYIKEMEKTWKDYDFDDRMERAILDDVPEGAAAIEASDNFASLLGKGAIGSDKLGVIGDEKIVAAVSNLVKITGTLSGSTALGNGDQAVLTVTLDDTADLNRIMLGVCHITPFHSAVSGAKVIPYGADEDATHWLWKNQADWNSNNNRKSTWVDFVHNVGAGAAQTVLWRIHYRYFGKSAKES